MIMLLCLLMVQRYFFLRSIEDVEALKGVKPSEEISAWRESDEKCGSEDEKHIAQEFSY